MIKVSPLWRKRLWAKERWLSLLEELWLRKTSTMKTKRTTRLERLTKNKLINNLLSTLRSITLKLTRATRTKSSKISSKRRWTSFRKSGTSLQNNTSSWRTSLSLWITNCYISYKFYQINLLCYKSSSKSVPSL